MKQFNAVVHIGEPFSDKGEWINVSIITPDQQEHEIMIRKEDFVIGNSWIPAEYWVHPSCCEHPNGCPDGSATEKFLTEKNKS